MSKFHLPRQFHLPKRVNRFAILVLILAIVSRIMVYVTFPRYSIGIPWNPEFETYNDFTGIYLPWFHSLSSGLLPYGDFFYQYPPLFLYGLYPLYYFGGRFGVALGIMLFDSGSAVLIYLIARQISIERNALIAGIGYALNPFALLYEGYVLFSLQPMLFFLLLAVLLLRQKKLMPSAISLAVAILFRQEAFLGLPAYVLQVRKFDLRTILKATSVFLTIIFAISLPFLLLAPTQYVSSMAYRIVLYPSSSGQPTTTTPVGGAFLGVVVQRNILFVLLALLPALLVLNVLYSFRRRAFFFPLSVAYSFAFLTMVFAFFVSYVPLEEVARYPYLPVYALLLVAPTNKKGPVAAVGFSILSLLLPPGIIQIALPFIAIFGVMVLEEHRLRKTESSENRVETRLPKDEDARGRDTQGLQG